MAARYAGRTPAVNVVSLREAVLDLFESLRATLTTRLHLVALEGRRAGGALAKVVAMGVLAALLTITAWLVAVWGIVWGLVALGVAPWAAVLIVVAANLVGVWICWLVLKSAARKLLFPATMRHLHVSNPADPANAMERVQ